MCLLYTNILVYQRILQDLRKKGWIAGWKVVDVQDGEYFPPFYGRMNGFHKGLNQTIGGPGFHCFFTREAARRYAHTFHFKGGMRVIKVRVPGSALQSVGMCNGSRAFTTARLYIDSFRSQ